MARLYLIRHGRPSATWGGHDDDPGLDERVRRRIDVTAAVVEPGAAAIGYLVHYLAAPVPVPVLPVLPALRRMRSPR